VTRADRPVRSNLARLTKRPKPSHAESTRASEHADSFSELPQWSDWHQFLDGAGVLLDRHIGVDPMLVERVDVVGAEVAQAVVGDLADVLGEMSKPYSCVHPNFVAITCGCRKLRRG
jgi:hypothetical protein